MKISKSETENETRVERNMYTRRYCLILDKNKCVGCEICKAACPKEAIDIAKPVKIQSEKVLRPRINMDANKCNFCGICSAICPFGALTLRVNEEEVIPVLKTESFPQVVRQIEVDETKCPRDCTKCEEACPFDLIKVNLEESTGRVRINIDEKYCPCCRLCEVKCPKDAIHVRKIILGSTRINNEKCPEDCRDCVDACPIPDVLHVAEDGKVHVNDFHCVYCGICKIVCPAEGALEIQRTSIHHKPIHSGAWNKALEKLTSTNVMAKELRGKLITKTRESVKRRFK